MMARVPRPAFASEGDDFEVDGHFAWLVRELDAGRVQPPPERALAGPGVSLSLGDACEVDPGLLAAMCGPDGLGGQAAGAAFGQDSAADVLRPGPVLAALTAGAVARAGSLAGSELIGALQAARRLANLAAYQQTVVIAEFARRRQGEFEAARARGVPAGCRGRGVPRRGTGDGAGRHRRLHRGPDRHGGRADEPAAPHPGRDGRPGRSTWTGLWRSRCVPAR